MMTSQTEVSILRQLAARLTSPIKRCRPGESDGYYGGSAGMPERACVCLCFHNNYACHEVNLHLEYDDFGIARMSFADIGDMFSSTSGSPVGCVSPLNKSLPSWLISNPQHSI